MSLCKYCNKEKEKMYTSNSKMCTDCRNLYRRNKYKLETDEGKAKIREYQKKYYNTENGKAKVKEKQKRYLSNPGAKEKYNQYQKEYQKNRWVKKKLKRQNEQH
jgi:hypothetical protein